MSGALHIARRGTMQYPVATQPMLLAHYRTPLGNVNGSQRVRTRSEDRVELIIVNTSGGDIQLGTRTENNNNYNSPSTWPYTVPAGSEAVITDDTTQWHARRVDGTAGVLVDVYVREIA
ncbi:MAG: hypothetical protein ACM3JF_00625 [Sphaerimonospora mesophila]